LNLVGGAKDFTLGEAVPCGKYNVWSGVYWSKDGGRTWGQALMPGFPGDKNTTLLSHYQCNSDPVLAFGSDGTAYYSGLAYGGSANSTQNSGVCPGDQAAPLCEGSVWTASSKDGGATWESFANVAVSDANTAGLDKQWFATDPTNPNNLVMTWIQFTGVAAYFLTAVSSDKGVTWSPPLTLAELDAPVHQFAMPAYGPDGSVYYVWRNFGAAGIAGAGGPPLPATPLGTPGAAQVMFTKTAVAGTPSIPPAIGVAPVHDVPSPLPNGKYRLESITSVAVDLSSGPNKGDIYIVWPDWNGKDSDVLLVSSSDGGLTWTAPLKVNQDAGGDQFMPWVTIAEDGGVIVSWYDRSYDPANTKLDITHARSIDGGKTWGQMRITDRSWDVPDGCYHQTGPPFIGDYHGVVALGGMAHPFFADGITGKCEVWTASVPYAAIGGNSTTGNRTLG
ncbi:MAG: hypothetical protein LC624_07265, partial [Halobacteriales archaeon]|nr:hypothetical protein [Halobacteriales archaeon]